MKKLMTVAMTMSAAVAMAMPTKQDIRMVQPMVRELMSPIVGDYKDKRKTASEVAEAALAYAEKSETEAAKFIFYRSSIPYFIKDEAYDRAADSVELLKKNIKDVPPSVVEEIIAKATVRATEKKAPRLFGMYRVAKRQSVASQELAEVRAKQTKSPNSRALVRLLAETLAASGDWKAALDEFAKLTDMTGKMAKDEIGGKADDVALGEFWWAYSADYENAEDTFRLHAAEHFRKALDDGKVTGLKKSVIEQRLASLGLLQEGSAAPEAQVAAKAEEPAKDEPEETPVVVPAEKSACVAQVENGEFYESLEDALWAADGKTVKLLKDLAGKNYVIQTGANAVLDLNGRTIEGAGGGYAICVKRGATLTLTDSSKAGSGRLVAPARANGDRGGVWNDGTFVMAGGTIEKCWAFNGGALHNDGTFVMEGGVIRNCSAEWGGASYTSGKFTMAGGTIENCPSPNGVIRLRSGEFEVTGGQIDGGFRYDGGCRISVTGGEFTFKPDNSWLADGAVVKKGRNRKYPFMVEGPKTDGTVLSGLQTDATTTLSDTKKPYVVEGQYVVSAGKALVVKEGVTLVFRKGAGIAVDKGSFSVEGSSARPVVFKGETKEVGGWKGVIVRSADSVTVKGAVFSGAERGLLIERVNSATVQSCAFVGNVVGVEGHISKFDMTDCVISKNEKDGYHGGDQGCVTMDHCTVENNGGWGVAGPFKFAAGLKACVIRNNRAGGYYAGRMGTYSVTPQPIVGCAFESNGQFDVKIDNGLTWPCTGNWWGAATTRVLSSKGAGAVCERIVDARQNGNLGVVDLSGFLTALPKDCGARNYPRF